MKKVTGILWLSLLFVAVTPGGAIAQGGRSDNRSGDRVCVYQNNYFQGWEECYRPGDEVADLHARGNNISSIRIYGNAMVTIYDGKNFEGRSAQITSDVKDLAQLSAAGGFRGQANWNDRVESFRVTSSNFRAPVSSRDDRYDNRQGRRDGVCIYEDTDYRGRVECFDAGMNISDLGRSGAWSDRISSIRIVGDGRVAAFVDIGFHGERLVIDQDVPDLKQLRLRNGKTWDNQISSLEVSGGRRTGR